MSELRAIVGAARALLARREPFLVATVVAVRGSSYRRPGARMIVSEAGEACGSVSGGCLEKDIVRRGAFRARGASAVLVTYDARSEDAREGFGLGCDGAVDVLLERAGAEGSGDRALFLLGRCLEGETDGVIVTVVRAAKGEVPLGARLTLARGGAPEGDVGDAELSAAAEACLARKETFAFAARGGAALALAEYVQPPPHLFVCGTGHDAVPLVLLARTLGWTVTVCDVAARFETAARFAAADRRVVGPAARLTAAIDGAHRAAVVVMGHRYERDAEVLAAVLPSRARYVAVLGPARRTARILAEIGAPPDPRLHAPAGLAIGADAPAEIALAILAEAQAALAGATAGQLRDRPGPIHARERREAAE